MHRPAHMRIFCSILEYPVSVRREPKPETRERGNAFFKHCKQKVVQICVFWYKQQSESS